ncbi:MAG: Protein phosphatase PrpC [Gemmatimonadaceae bacterium]|nr:Protein phosphatase PrpC [Gemmatimonadaceae bacterium]
MRSIGSLDSSWPLGRRMRLDAHGRTDRGKARDVNEDNFAIATVRRTVTMELTSLAASANRDMGLSEAHVLIVADGVGGLAGGELASAMTVETIIGQLGQLPIAANGADPDAENDFIGAIERLAHRAHALIQETYGAPGRAPATTLTMVVLSWPRAYYVHVGDSRAYYLHRGRLRQLTRDQTTGDYAVDLGIMTEEKARKAGLFNRLSSAIGAELTSSAGLIDLDDADVLLLCTDGLTKHVTDDQIADVLRLPAPSPEKTARLLQRALDAGGSDNVTAIVAQVAEA